MRIGRIGMGAVAAATIVAGGAARAQEVGVVASIAPLHSLVAGVMGELGIPHLVVRGAGSPHHYALRPSDAAAFESAGAVFLIGEGLETFLAGPIATLADGAVSVELGAAPGVHRLAMREGGVWAQDNAHRDEEGEDRRDDHGATDPHVWLDPENASAMVAEIARTLVAADPGNAESYEANAAALSGRLRALTADLEAVLAPVAERPFIVFHDGFQYFEHRFGLAAAGSVTVDPERQPGAERLAAIREAIRERGARCVFAEPQFEPRLIEVLIEDTGARAGVLDPLGAELEPGPDLYFTLMRRNAESLAGCLGDGV